MGFIGGDGCRQHLRDARILPIYEGTNGIQARDLVGRKVTKDGGETMLALVGEMRALAAEMKAGARRRHFRHLRWCSGLGRRAGGRHQVGGADRQGRARQCAGGLSALPAPGRNGAGAAGCSPRAPWWPSKKLSERDGDPAFLEAKLITARFYAEVILPPALAQLGPLKSAGRTVFALREEQF